MPPEPLPWDRKELLRERKHAHDIARWRDSPSSSSYGGSRNANPDFSPRWGFHPDFRRPPGHGKQGGWQMYPEDHGYPAPRSGDRVVDDDVFRPSGPRGDGRYGRVYRENRAAFGQKDWRGHFWEANHHHSAPTNGTGRPHIMNDQRAVGDSPMHASNAHSDPCDQFHSKDQVDKPSEASESGMVQRVDKENSLGSLDWKPFKWSRSGSVTSRGSGFSHSSSSKSIGGESSDMKIDFPPKNDTTPVQSSSGDAVTFLPSAVPAEETSSRKKPRLGWGEGLAKYEKKKVEVPEENVNKLGASNSIVEPVHSLSSSLVDKSPKVTGISDCSSPATPSSFACSSSPGLEDKPYGKTIDADGDANNLTVSSILVPENQPVGSPFNLEKLELNSITNLSSLLNELLLADDQCSMDSGFMRSSALNKLLLWKGDISKALELTETEIDSLENELKLLKSDSVQSFPCPASSNPLPADCRDGPSDGLTILQRPPPLEVVSPGDVIMEDNILPRDEARGAIAETKDEDIDSPGTATSKFVEPVSIQKPVSLDVCINFCSGDGGFFGSTKSTTENLATYVKEEITAGASCQVDDRNMIQDGSVATGRFEHPGVCDEKEVNICETVLASNEASAARASEVLSGLLPHYDYSMEANGVSCLPADSTIKEKFLRRKRFLRFKERVISLKYKAFHHLWKEDLRLLSLRSHRTKLLKKPEMSLRTFSSFGNEKYRSSIRSRFASPAGSLSLVPTTEIINFTGKLLSDSQVRIYRNSLKMPAMILDEKEKMLSRFLSTNGLVEDPCAVEKERALINPWTCEEKEIFMDKLAIHGKDFRKIASFLDHKTTADCIEFYYKNHKSECFEKTKKPELKKQGKPLSTNTYLVTSGKKWSREMNAASLDILGAASVIAAQADHAMETSKLLSGKSSNRKSRGSDGITEASSSYYAAEDERETTAADVLAGICGSLSSEAMSSCITSSIDPGEGNHEWKHQKFGSSTRQPLTLEVTQNVNDDDTCSDESCGELDPVDWTDDEKSLFVRAFSSHGKDFSMISRCVRTKSRDQCKIFFSKARKCLGLDASHPETGTGGNLASNDTKGGGSDTEDAGVVETVSVVCSDKSGSRTDEDLPHMNQDVSKPEPAVAELNTLEESCGPGQLDHKDADMKPEPLLLSDHLADVSDPVLGSGVVDFQDNNSAAAADIQNSGVHLITRDDKSKLDVAVDIVVPEVVPHVSSVAMDQEPVVVTTNGESAAKFENGKVHTSSEPAEVGGPTDGSCRQSATGNDAHRPQFGISLMNEVESSQDLKSLPLDLSIEAEMDNVIDHKVRSESKAQPFQHCYLRKCNGTASSNSVAELPLRRQSVVPINDHGSSKEEKPSGNGDVKLFGKILSKPSSVEPTSGGQGHDKAKHHPTSGVKFDMKLAPDQGINGDSTSSKHDHNGFTGLENLPTTRYGFWDGTRIPTGFSSLPDSALLLAKYPAAFGNYSISSPKTEQQLQPQPLQATAITNKCNVNTACVFSQREFNSSNAVLDYPVLRNQEVVQPHLFRVNTKQRPQGVFPEVQRNGLEAISSGLVKLNVVQGGDILGASCAGISDPVAALKLHYASQQYDSHSEPWRGQGDVGR